MFVKSNKTSPCNVCVNKYNHIYSYAHIYSCAHIRGVYPKSWAFLNNFKIIQPKRLKFCTNIKQHTSDIPVTFLSYSLDDVIDVSNQNGRPLWHWFYAESCYLISALEGNAAKEISERLKNVYGDSALSYASVKRWVTQFKSGSSSITDKPRSGRPSTPSLRKTECLLMTFFRKEKQ